MPDLEALRGDTNIYDINIVRQGAAVDIEDAKIWFTAKHAKTDPDADAVISKNSEDDPAEVVISNSIVGRVQVILISEDTADLEEPVALYYDVQLLEASGSITTVATGILRVTLDVTDAIV